MSTTIKLKPLEFGVTLADYNANGHGGDFEVPVWASTVYKQPASEDGDTYKERVFNDFTSAIYESFQPLVGEALAFLYVANKAYFDSETITENIKLAIYAEVNNWRLNVPYEVKNNVNFSAQAGFDFSISIQPWLINYDSLTYKTKAYIEDTGLLGVQVNELECLRFWVKPSFETGEALDEVRINKLDTEIGVVDVISSAKAEQLIKDGTVNAHKSVVGDINAADVADAEAQVATFNGGGQISLYDSTGTTIEYDQTKAVPGDIVFLVSTATPASFKTEEALVLNSKQMSIISNSNGDNAEIAANTADITKNATDIAENKKVTDKALTDDDVITPVTATNKVITKTELTQTETNIGKGTKFLRDVQQEAEDNTGSIAVIKAKQTTQNSDITKNGTDIGTNASGISNLVTRADDLEQEVQTLENEVINNKTEADATKAIADQNKLDIATDNTHLTTLDGEVKANKTEADATKVVASTNTTNIATNTANISTNTGDITDVKTEQTTQNSRLTALESTSTANYVTAYRKWTGTITGTATNPTDNTTDIDLSSITGDDGNTFDFTAGNDFTVWMSASVATIPFELNALIQTDRAEPQIIQLVREGGGGNDIQILYAKLSTAGILTLTRSDGTELDFTSIKVNELSEVIRAAATGLATKSELAPIGIKATAADTLSKANEGKITTNTAGIAKNVTDIATNKTNISKNTVSITANTTTIATVKATATTAYNEAAANKTNITKNTTAIATNTTHIATNTSGVAANKASAATNATHIAANTAKGNANATAIAHNTTGLAGKQDKTDSALSTTSKSIVGAINEVKIGSDLATKIGALKTSDGDTLSTTTEVIQTVKSNPVIDLTHLTTQDEYFNAIEAGKYYIVKDITRTKAVVYCYAKSATTANVSGEVWSVPVKPIVMIFNKGRGALISFSANNFSIPTPTQDLYAANKKYVDDRVASGGSGPEWVTHYFTSDDEITDGVTKWTDATDVGVIKAQLASCIFTAKFSFEGGSADGALTLSGVYGDSSKSSLEIIGDNPSSESSDSYGSMYLNNSGIINIVTHGALKIKNISIKYDKNAKLA